MRKLLALSLLAFSAFGLVPSSAAEECSDPVSVNCDHTYEDGSVKHCTLWVDAGLDNGYIEGCYIV